MGETVGLQWSTRIFPLSHIMVILAIIDKSLLVGYNIILVRIIDYPEEGKHCIYHLRTTHNNNRIFFLAHDQ